MPDELQYREVYGEESHGSYGAFGLKISVAPDHGRDLSDSEAHALYKASELIKDAFMTEAIRRDPKAMAAACAEREQLLALFSAPIYVEEIPNGYCSDWCCRHLPWFRVWTTKGPIVIGWRKRVIQIDWSDSTVAHTAEQLFSSENVTKSCKGIHAWGYEKAGEYVRAIFGGTDAR